MEFDRVADHDAEAVTGEDREAAVVVPVIERGPGEYHVLLFTKRADHLSDHPGQMSFPGGGLQNPRTTTCSGPRSGRPRRRSDSTPRPSTSSADWTTSGRFRVTPSARSWCAFQTGSTCRRTRTRSPEVVVLPVHELVDRGNYESERRDHPYYGDIRLHFFYVDGYTVWGATARMLVQFLEAGDRLGDALRARPGRRPGRRPARERP